MRYLLPGPETCHFPIDTSQLQLTTSWIACLPWLRVWITVTRCHTQCSSTTYLVHSNQGLNVQTPLPSFIPESRARYKFAGASHSTGFSVTEARKVNVQTPTAVTAKAMSLVTACPFAGGGPTSIFKFPSILFSFPFYHPLPQLPNQLNNPKTNKTLPIPTPQKPRHRSTYHQDERHHLQQSGPQVEATAQAAQPNPHSTKV